MVSDAWSSVHGTRYTLQVHGVRYTVLLYGPRSTVYALRNTLHGTWYTVLASWYTAVHDTCLDGYAASTSGGNLIVGSGGLPSLPCIG